MTYAVPVDGKRVQNAQTSLTRFGYALVSERMLGFDEQLRTVLRTRYFDAGALRADLPDIPADRERARDVVRYEWSVGSVALSEHPFIGIVDRDGRPGVREYHRVFFLETEPARRWIAAVLSLVPPQQRQQRGTLGINLFRTHTQVVTAPHQDDEEFIIVYVVAKVGGGAETELHDVKTGELAVKHTLEPGDLIIFRDQLFRHNVTRLTPPSHGAPYRDAVVCTIDYSTTHKLTSAAV